LVVKIFFVSLQPLQQRSSRIDIARVLGGKKLFNFFSQNFGTFKNFLTFATASTEGCRKQKELKNSSNKY